MIAKIIEGKSFSGCVSYILKEKSEIIDSNGLCIINPNTITRDFNLQRQLNPNLNKAVGHIVLAWHENDGKRIDNSIMAIMVRQYLDKMNIKNTQYLAVRHYDRNHPHLHIVYNRVGFNGKTIANNNFRLKSVNICKELNAKYRFYQANGKDNINVGRLKSSDKAKHQIYFAIKSGLSVCKDWNQLEGFLKYKGVSVQFKYKSQSSEIQGVSFQKGEFAFKGSEIDRSLSFNEIEKIFNPIELRIVENSNDYMEASQIEKDDEYNSGLDFNLEIAQDHDDEYGKKKKHKLKNY